MSGREDSPTADANARQGNQPPPGPANEALGPGLPGRFKPKYGHHCPNSDEHIPSKIIGRYSCLLT